MLWLVSLSSGVRLSLPASAFALLLTAVWSVIISCAKVVTSGFLVMAFACLPLAMSALFAATTMAAMLASLNAGAAGCSDIVLGGVAAFDMSSFADDDPPLAHDVMPKASAASSRGGIDIRIQRSRSIISFSSVKAWFVMWEPRS